MATNATIRRHLVNMRRNAILDRAKRRMHGRPDLGLVTGKLMKLFASANDPSDIYAFGGDGDCYAAHVRHCVKRMRAVLHDYGYESGDAWLRDVIARSGARYAHFSGCTWVADMVDAKEIPVQ